MSVALVPGSFDPMTVGHMDIVKRALALYDEVIVAVMVNDEKCYEHTIEQRAKTVELTVGDLPGVRIVTSTGLLIDLFDEVGADAIVKGVRNEQDRAYEEKMAAWNLERNPRAKTVFLQAADDYETVSSSAARAMVKKGELPHEMVTPAVAAYLSELALEKSE